ncbi:MAG: chorismate mutase [Actinomycetota bacterium]|nr:chorismate mutase [Actinomycetota bacterium]
MSSDRQRVRGLRGAITVEADTPGAIVGATVELLEAMLERNGARTDDLISVVFTSTADLVSEFPAAAARQIGISEVPLLCAQEIPVPDSVPRCIRVLMHLYTERDYASLRHVYLRDARALRTDLPE